MTVAMYHLLIWHCHGHAKDGIINFLQSPGLWGFHIILAQEKAWKRYVSLPSRSLLRLVTWSVLWLGYLHFLTAGGCSTCPVQGGWPKRSEKTQRSFWMLQAPSRKQLVGSQRSARTCRRIQPKVSIGKVEVKIDSKLRAVHKAEHIEWSAGKQSCQNLTFQFGWIQRITQSHPSPQNKKTFPTPHPHNVSENITFLVDTPCSSRTHHNHKPSINHCKFHTKTHAVDYPLIALIWSWDSN